MAWVEAEERFYLDLLKEGRRPGRMDEGSKQAFFKECVDRMKPSYSHVSAGRLNSKRAAWKAKWDLFLRLFGKTGFSFDEETGWFSAEDENWDALAKGPLKECCWFRRNRMPYYHDLEEVFSKSAATGILAQGRGRGRGRGCTQPMDEAMDPVLTESSQSQTEAIGPTPGPTEEEVLMASIEDGISKRVLKRSSSDPLSSSSSPAPSEARLSSKRRKQSGSSEFNRTIMSLAAAILEEREAEKEERKRTQSQWTVKQQAIRHLQTKYGDLLSMEKMIKVVRVVSEQFETFMELQPELQQAWLMDEVNRG